MGEATKFSTMKASIILCLLLKLSKAIGEDVVSNIDNVEIHGRGLLDPPEDDKVDEASEQYFNHFRSLNHFRSRSSVPASYSSVEKGLVSPVKNQRNCGSCVAFASTAAIETCFKRKVGVFGDYSEQQLLDCGYGPQHGASGCQGAAPDAYLWWAVENNVGLAHESQYPYKDARYQCPNNLPIYNQGVRISNFSYTDIGDEDLLMQQVYEHGAAMTTIHSNFTAFNDYEGGIFDGCPEGRRDHAVTVVGYGTENGTPYWLIKNSWGTTWGENGFMKMKRGVNMCGIGRHVTVVKCETVAGPTDPPITCYDVLPNCTALAEKYCYKERVGENCRKSCGLCPGMTPASSYTCFDKYPNCPALAKEKCYQERVGQNCRKSCGLCPGMTPASSNTCFDRYDNCPALAEKDCNQ